MSEPTSRQIEVLVAYIECGNRRAAADRLGISEWTVVNHLAAIRQVFEVQTTAQAFAIAVQSGFIDPRWLKVPVA